MLERVGQLFQFVTLIQKSLVYVTWTEMSCFRCGEAVKIPDNSRGHHIAKKQGSDLGSGK